MNNKQRESSSGIKCEAGFGGFLMRWLICGPFNQNGPLSSCEALNHDFLLPIGGENGARPRSGQEVGTTGIRWKQVEARYGFKIDLLRCNPGANVIAYAAAYLVSPSARTCRIGVGSDDGHHLWINGRRVGEHHIHRGLGIDNDLYAVQIQEGVNVILIKVEQNFGALEFCVRVTDSNGKAFEDLRLLYDHPEQAIGVKVIAEASAQANLTDNDVFSYLTESSPRSLQYNARNQEDHFAWRKNFIARMEQSLGPIPPAGPLRTKVIDGQNCSGYRIEKLHYDLMPGIIVPAYLLIPDAAKMGQPCPLILNLHGHGRGKEDMIGAGLHEQIDSGRALADWQLPYASAPIAAGRGFAVFVGDFLPFGERLAGATPGADTCDAAALWAIALGYSLCRLNLHAIVRAIDYLETRSEIDANRISVMGHSFGGFMSMLCAAMDERIKACVISGMLGSFQMAKGGRWYCGSQTIPGILQYGDMADIASLIAPRPLLAISGMYDCCAPFNYAVTAFTELTRAYDTLNAFKHLKQYAFPGEHVFQPDQAIDFLANWTHAS